MNFFNGRSITVRIRKDSDGYFSLERKIFWFLWQDIYTDIQGQPKRFYGLAEAEYYKKQFLNATSYNEFVEAKYTYKEDTKS